MNLLLAATLLLASVLNINADAADIKVPGLRGVDTANASDADDEAASGRHLQASLGDWAFCTNSSQCKNSCCSSKYSNDGRLKCTPVGGFKPSEGCVGSATPPAPSPTPPPPSPTSLKGDWQLCSTSNECQNSCCSSKYSTTDGRLKCTPVGGFKPSEGCVGSATPPAPSPTPPPPSPTSLKGDWQLCSTSNECQNSCCSSKYSTTDGRLKCTPVGGFKPSEGCVGSATPPAPSPTPPSPTPPPPAPSPTSSHRMVDYLKQITGKNTVAGIHNRVNTDVNWGDVAQWRPTGPSVFTDYARQITGKTPGMWSGDFLFDWPNALSQHRWSMIYEAERQYNAGALVNIMFHTCNPRLRENENTQCDWGDSTNGPQSKLTDDEWSRLITDGGDLNKNWKERLDNIAMYLQYLEDKNVEVMFRPLHEMNQGKFWWGGRPGSQGTRRLYQITHDYLTINKGLTNLIWVWNVQDLAGFSNELVSSYNPGNSYWDIATLDVYEGFDPWKYNVMVKASNGKPIAIGECSTLPSVTTLNNQPNWSFFMSWSELTFKGNSNTDIQSVYNSNRAITLEEMPGWK